MSENKVINIVDLINKRKGKSVKALKKELNKAIDHLDISIDDILHSFVNPKVMPYNTNVDDNKLSTLTYARLSLKNTADLLDHLGYGESAEDIKKVISNLNNKINGENDEIQS